MCGGTDRRDKLKAGSSAARKKACNHEGIKLPLIRAPGHCRRALGFAQHIVVAQPETFSPPGLIGTIRTARLFSGGFPATLWGMYPDTKDVP